MVTIPAHLGIRSRKVMSMDSERISIFCDESCHLENDGINTMVLGALSCPKIKVAQYNNEISEIKRKHNLSKFFEIKWTKTSNAKQEFYNELIDFFFSKDDLRFRALIVKNKSKLNHNLYNQTHDQWYYKMYFILLRNIIHSNNNYDIYLDIKDTRSSEKLDKLHNVLSTSNYDFNRDIITKMQHVHSHDICLLQLSDLLIGALAYNARKLENNLGKLSIIKHISKLSSLTLNRSTLPNEYKFNLFFWDCSSKEQS